jgi:hypothetical protein
MSRGSGIARLRLHDAEVSGNRIHEISGTAVPSVQPMETEMLGPIERCPLSGQSLLVAAYCVALLTACEVAAPGASLTAPAPLHLSPRHSENTTGETCGYSTAPVGGETNTGTFWVWNHSCREIWGTWRPVPGGHGLVHLAGDLGAGNGGFFQAYAGDAEVCFSSTYGDLSGPCFHGPSDSFGVSQPIPTFIYTAPAPPPPCVPHDVTVTYELRTFVIHESCKAKFRIRRHFVSGGVRG